MKRRTVSPCTITGGQPDSCRSNNISWLDSSIRMFEPYLLAAGKRHALSMNGVNLSYTGGVLRRGLLIVGNSCPPVWVPAMPRISDSFYIGLLLIMIII